MLAVKLCRICRHRALDKVHVGWPVCALGADVEEGHVTVGVTVLVACIDVMLEIWKVPACWKGPQTQTIRLMYGLKPLNSRRVTKS
jgi:hypothetical protein